MATIPNKVVVRLTSGIKKFQSILKSAKEKDINESDTVTIVMDMLAEVFGYEKYSEITSEYAVKKTYCDLAIKIDGKLRFLIEIKAIGLELKTDYVRQAVNYGSYEGLEWVILTNGSSWKVFKISFDKPIDYNLIYEFDMLSLNPKKTNELDLLYYISKESLGRSALEDYLIERLTLNKFFIGQVLLSDPVLENLRKTIRKICPEVRLTSDEIKDVLIRDVLRREIFDEEKASSEARRKISKAFKAPSKNEALIKSDQPVI
jgi:hypothetical protein